MIYSAAPWTADAGALVHDPRSVVGAPSGLAAVIDADLAREYLRAWSQWHDAEPDPNALVHALVAWVAPRLVRPTHIPPGLARHRATMQSGRSYDDPSDDLLYRLFLDMEAGQELFMVVHRLGDAGGQGFVHVLRDDDGAYVLEQRSGEAGHSGIVKPTMPWAYLALCDWIFLGRDVTVPTRQPTDLVVSGQAYAGAASGR
jgi:hypothetical protein